MDSNIESIIAAATSQQSSYTVTDNRAATESKLNYKTTCIDMFNAPFELYKKVLNQDKNVKNMYNTILDDHLVFQDIYNGIHILIGMIKYAIFSSKDLWDSQNMASILELNGVNNPIDIDVKLPKDTDHLLNLFRAYPWTLDYLNPELYDIISLENFELITMLSNIKPNLYFSTFVDEEDAMPVKVCKNDVVVMWVNIKAIVKKLLKHHVEIAKMRSV